MNLTKRQQEIYHFLETHLNQFEYPPSLDELCHALGVRSRGSMHKHIQALVDAGLLEPMSGKQRGIRLKNIFSSSEDAHCLPFLGDIAAGIPFEAIENAEPIEVPSHLRTNKPCYVLRVKGDSMIDAGIIDGDWVIIEHCHQAQKNDIVVALIDQQEVSLKYFEQKHEKIFLHPANASMMPLCYDSQRVQIQGVLVGQMRQYR
ncbi:MAG: transcriptional repressor LexA [Gammaproteobacteria bacterium]|nr:transcriptional repressor LexA [Gammaproteobacteria bacterium]MDH5730776.1 transcriptional repressor LexA [Gammaproteobacteria bacterium]